MTHVRGVLGRVGRHIGGNVVAYVALFVALSGTAAYAAGTIGSADIIDNSVASVDIHNKGVKQVDLQPAESWHEVGGPGEPFFKSPFQNDTFGGLHATVGFYRDPFGRVHLKGTTCMVVVGACDSGTASFAENEIFTLPVGYRPEARLVFPAMAHLPGKTDAEAVRINVSADGVVELNTSIVPDWLSLDDITFRCAPSGSNGCP